MADASATTDPELTPDDDPIPGAVPPDVSGRYAGTIKDRTPSAGFVAYGTVRFIVHQTGTDVSGSIDTEFRGMKQSDPFVGTVARTQRGAILHLNFSNAAGRPAGMWAKAIGSSFFGKGWADPDAATQQPYDKLIFSAHQT